jgi:hypothetical protein
VGLSKCTMLLENLIASKVQILEYQFLQENVSNGSQLQIYQHTSKDFHFPEKGSQPNWTYEHFENFKKLVTRLRILIYVNVGNFSLSAYEIWESIGFTSEKSNLFFFKF